MKRLFISTLVSLIFFSQCVFAQTTNIKSFMFGHSLMDHRPPAIPTPSDETTIAHWIYLLASEANHTYSAAGQYGFLPQHDNLPPFSQWGYDIVPPAWDSDSEDFDEANFNNVLITAGNFMQWQAPDEEYPSDPGVSPISATQTIVNWLEANEPGIKIYIYENWPDMAPYLTGGVFPPTSSDLTNYYNYLNSDFHDWWIDYHDAILLSNPAENVRMIPVGPILSDLLQNTVLNTIPALELYEDDAPHGRASLYFLAGLVTYMAIYEEEAPASFTVPPIVHATIGDNYSLIVSHIWSELQAFNLPNGASRVFFDDPLPVELAEFKATKNESDITLNWTTLSEISNEKFEVEYSIDGLSFRKIAEVAGMNTTSIEQRYSFSHVNYSSGWNYYRLKQIDFDGAYEYSPIAVVEVKRPFDVENNFYPNPSPDGILGFQYASKSDGEISVEVTDLNGHILKRENQYVSKGKNDLSFDFSALGNGVFLVKVIGNNRAYTYKILLEKN